MNEKLIIPGSIIISGLIIGGAIFFGNSSTATSPTVQVGSENQSITSKKVDPDTDHIYGSPDADIFVIEYSDLECPFCKRYHDDVLSRLKTEYKDNDKVAFVFRHFPLDEPYTRALHPNAREEHIAAECVARLAGNDAFFTFTDSIFAATASDGNYDLSNLSGLAVQAGANKESFDACFTNEDTGSIVDAAFKVGTDAGVQGTPAVHIQTDDGTTYPAAPDYGVIKTALDAYLSELK